MKINTAILCTTLLATACHAAEVLPPDQAAIKAHLEFLASDVLHGRETGTKDYDVAAAYVATRMEDAGLAPAGDNGGWYQSVPLITSQAEKPGTLLLNSTPLTFGTDFIGWENFTDENFSLAGSMIFAGYGVVDPSSGEDDYKGIDCRGKIAVVFYGAPQSYPSEMRAHLGDLDVKRRSAKLCGATGLLVIESTALHSYYPFNRLADTWNQRHMAVAEATGKPENQDPPVFAAVSLASAAKLFVGSKFNWEQVAKDERAGRRLPSGALAIEMKFEQKFKIEHLTSQNIVGRLDGSDPLLKEEYVVLSAHLDHIGLGAAVDGDTTYNGAIDNAIGVASMIEVAKRFQATGKAPKRGLVFVALTGEEKGLLGSAYFAAHPTVPLRKLVGNINVDAPILTYNFKDLTVYGAERSSLGSLVAATLNRNGYILSPDPHPEEGYFVRSDSYSFVKQGIPAIWVSLGFAGSGKAAAEDYEKNHYHQPSDDAKLPFDWAAASAFVKLNHDLVEAIANAPQRPEWVKHDYFGTLFGGHGAK